MKNTKFVVKVNGGGSHAPEYVQRIDRTYASLRRSLDVHAFRDGPLRNR